jgi:hypothetical protein
MEGSGSGSGSRSGSRSGSVQIKTDPDPDQQHCFVGQHINYTRLRTGIEQKMRVWTVFLALGKIVDLKHFMVNI